MYSLSLHFIEIANLHKKNNMGKLSPVFFYKCGGGNNPRALGGCIKIL